MKLLNIVGIVASLLPQIAFGEDGIKADPDAVKKEIAAARKAVEASGRPSQATDEKAKRFADEVQSIEQNEGAPKLSKLRELKCYKSGCIIAFWLGGQSAGENVMKSIFESRNLREWTGPQYWSPVVEENGKQFFEIVLLNGMPEK